MTPYAILAQGSALAFSAALFALALAGAEGKYERIDRQQQEDFAAIRGAGTEAGR